MSICSSPSTKENRFMDLIASIQHCSLCSRLCHRRKVFSSANGNINTKVVFIAEAPGRLGADQTGMPLWGDKTGENFEMLLNNIGWKREDIFITNALLCNPRDFNDNNSTPTQDELINCSPYLEMTLNLIQPDLIVTLGAVALNALSFIQSHKYKLNESVATLIEWNGIALFPLYHPAPRAAIHRSLLKQRGDFISLSKIVNPINGVISHKSRPKINKMEIKDTLTPIQETILTIMQSLKDVSYFKLTKLLYLIDLNAIQNFGHSITGSLYLRQQEGPWSPDLPLNLSNLKSQGINIYTKNNHKMVRSISTSAIELSLSKSYIELIQFIINKYRDKDDAGIKFIAYRTKPMQHVLKQEKLGVNMKNAPIIYQDTTIDMSE